MHPAGRMDGMRTVFSCLDEHLLTFLVGANCSRALWLWSPPGATRLSAWQSAWLGKASSFYRSILSIPRSCQPPCQTGPRCGILDMEAERDAGLRRIKAEDRSAVHVVARPRSSSLCCQPGFHSYFTDKLQVSSVSFFSASYRITLS